MQLGTKIRLMVALVVAIDLALLGLAVWLVIWLWMKIGDIIMAFAKAAA